MKYVAAMVACSLLACLNPVPERPDAGPCREDLGVAYVYSGHLEHSLAAGELRGGRYFVGPGLLIDAVSFEHVQGMPGWPVAWPCGTSQAGVQWLVQQDTAYLLFDFPTDRSRFTVAYEYVDQLHDQLFEACKADGGLGPTAVRLELTPDRARWWSRSAAIAWTESGFLACKAHLDDAGVAQEMALLRADDGGVLSTVPTSSGHCMDLNPPWALALSSRDNSYQLLNFDERRQVASLDGGDCKLTRDGAALCSTPGALTLTSGQGTTDLAREDGARFRPLKPTLRGRQFVRRESQDGGYAWFWFREGRLELLDEGMPVSNIGDFDDRNVFYVVAMEAPDGGSPALFERRCLPN